MNDTKKKVNERENIIFFKVNIFVCINEEVNVQNIVQYNTKYLAFHFWNLFLKTLPTYLFPVIVILSGKATFTNIKVYNYFPAN